MLNAIWSAVDGFMILRRELGNSELLGSVLHGDQQTLTNLAANIDWISSILYTDLCLALAEQDRNLNEMQF